MSTEEETLLYAVNEAAASLWLDDLPLDPFFVEAYLEEKMAELNIESPVLTLQRSDENA